MTGRQLIADSADCGLECALRLIQGKPQLIDLTYADAIALLCDNVDADQDAINDFYQYAKVLGLRRPRL